MGWLKKAGIIIGQVTASVVGLTPAIQMITSMTASKDDDKIVSALVDPLRQFASIVAQVEAMANALTVPLAGPEKLKMATPMIAQVILSSSLMVKHKIENPVLFRQGCASIASGMADVLNSLKGDVEAEDKT
jgi:hypothetical protein